MYEDYQGYDPKGESIEDIVKRLSAQQKMIASTISDVEGNASKITQASDEISLKVSKDSIISEINQTAETIKIQSSRINLVGAVTVLSEITGDLGTITAGTINGITINGVQINSANIDIDEDIRIGSQLRIRSTSTSGSDQSIIFEDNTGYPLSYISHYGDGGILIDANILKITDYVFTIDGSPLRVNNNTVLTDANFGTGYSDVARGNHGHTEYASSSHGHTTNSAGSHNHGIPNGTVLQKADGGTVTFVSYGGHYHSV